jgi:glycosyltransferase involved in cell wall biosynthesis
VQVRQLDQAPEPSLASAVDPQTAQPRAPADRSGTSRRALKILHVISGLRIGGAEGRLFALATAPSSAPLTHSVVSLVGGPYEQRLRAAGVPVTVLETGYGISAFTGLYTLARLIADQRPDVVQGWMYHGDVASTVGLWLSGRRAETALVWGICNSYLDERAYGLGLRAVRRLWVRLSGAPDLVISNSEAGVQAHHELGMSAAAARVIPNGIDTEVFRPDPKMRARLRAEWGISDDTTILVHAARHDAMKDHATFVTAVDSLAASGVKFTCVVAGSGTELLRPAAPAILLGERSDMPAVFAAGDIVVSSSAFGEGFSNVTAEGMAAGLPAVVTDVGDARRIVGDTGLVCPPRDPDQLADAIAQMIGEAPPKRRARGEAARRRIVEAYSLEREILAYAEAYDSVPSLSRSPEP